MHPKTKYEWILSTQQLLLRDSLVSLQGNSHLQNDKKKCIQNNMKVQFRATDTGMKAVVALEPQPGYPLMHQLTQLLYYSRWPST